MKTFDWDYFKKKASPERFKFLSANFDKPLTEDQYVKFIKEMPRNKLHASKTRSPNNSKRGYRKLRDDFGFFTQTSAILNNHPSV